MHVRVMGVHAVIEDHSLAKASISRMVVSTVVLMLVPIPIIILHVIMMVSHVRVMRRVLAVAIILMRRIIL